jgi:hypothetical protein
MGARPRTPVIAQPALPAAQPDPLPAALPTPAAQTSPTAQRARRGAAAMAAGLGMNNTMLTSPRGVAGISGGGDRGVSSLLGL